MRKVTLVTIFILIAVLLMACGTGASAPAQATTAKPVNIAVSTNPNPAVMGDVELIFTITDANGNPIEGATVDISADHIDMTGMTMSGVATEQGGGRYAIKANFSMSGNWKLAVSVRKDGLNYKEDIAIKIQ